MKRKKLAFIIVFSICLSLVVSTAMPVDSFAASKKAKKTAKKYTVTFVLNAPAPKPVIVKTAKVGPILKNPAKTKPPTIVTYPPEITTSEAGIAPGNSTISTPIYSPATVDIAPLIKSTAKISKKTKKVKYGKKYGTLPKPSRPNYKFMGWYTKKVGGKKVTANTKFTKKKNTKLYAHWKYKLPVTKKLAKKNTPPRPGLKLGKFKGVTIHNAWEREQGHGAMWLANALRGQWKNVQKSWHYAIDDKVISQSIPESEVSWQAGDGYYGKGNRNTVSIEICDNADSDMLAATERAAAMTARILKSHGIKKAVSNKNVFQHNYWSPVNKNCPAHIREGVPYSWKYFIQRVNEHLVADDI